MSPGSGVQTNDFYQARLYMNILYSCSLEPHFKRLPQIIIKNIIKCEWMMGVASNKLNTPKNRFQTLTPINCISDCELRQLLNDIVWICISNNRPAIKPRDYPSQLRVHNSLAVPKANTAPLSARYRTIACSADNLEAIMLSIMNRHECSYIVC